MARKSELTQPHHVLIIRFSALGDVCMTIPVVYSVCRANPGVRFTYLTKKPVTGLFIGAPENLSVVGADLKKDYSGALGALRLFNKIRREQNIDAIADLHSVLRTHIMDAAACLSGIRVAKIDKMRRQRQELISRGAAHAAALPPMTERYAEVFERLGLTVSGTEEPQPVTGTIDISTDDITAPKRPGEVWIAIAPFAAHRGKIYPEERMRTVVEALAAQTDTRLLLFGGGGHEAEVLERWAAEIPGVETLAGKKHGFAKELAVMAQCDVMVSMDSANMHLASLMGTPVASIWGATHPAAGFNGWKQSPDNSIQAEMPCRPCSIFGNKVCHRGGYQCMDAISTDAIVAKVLEIINRNKNVTDK